MLLAFVGVAGGLDLYPPLQARAANEVVRGPEGAYYNKMGLWATTKYKHMLTTKPADFPKPEILWNNSHYHMVYNGGLGNATTSLRHQVFLPPVAANGTPPATVTYYNPTNYPKAWTQDEYDAWDRYTGIVTHPTSKKKEFQIVGTAVPYRWFHTTFINHRVQIIARVHNSTKGTTKFVSTEAEILPMTQSRRYMLSFWNDKAMKTTNNMANDDKNLSNIIPANYFSGTFGMDIGALESTLRKEVSKICGLGIVGAEHRAGQDGINSNQSCNYLYDYAGFQANIPIEDIMLDGNTGGRDKITVEFKIAMSVVAPSGGTNYMVAHLDVLTDIQTEVPVYDGVGYELGTIEVHKYGDNNFDARESALGRNPLLARTIHYSLPGENDNSALPYLSSKERSYHLRNAYYLNSHKIANAYHYNKSSGTNGRNFKVYDNLHVATVVGAASYSGVQYGWKQGGTSWGNKERANDRALYRNKTKAGFAYAPSEYFYTNSLSISIQFVPNPDPSVNVNVYYIDKYNQKNIGQFKPNPEIINIRKSQGNEIITPNKDRMTVNRDGREWQFVETDKNKGSVIRSFTNNADVYFEYERVPDPYKDVKIYYMNRESHGQQPNAGNLVNGFVSNPKNLRIEFRGNITHKVENNEMVVNDTKVTRRRWKFEEYVGNPRSNTLKYDVGDDGVYNTSNASVKNLDKLFYYYTRYDDVQVRYVDADTINNTGGPDIIVSKNSPRYEELAFNNTLTVEAEDTFYDNKGNLWQLDDGQVAYPRIQSRKNDTAGTPATITFLYRRPYNVKIEHRQLLSDGTPGGNVTGPVLHREDIDLRLDRYATFSAVDDGKIPNHPKHNYVGAISVDGGTTIIPHDPRQVEMLVKKGMNQIIFYYMEPVLCDTSGSTFNGPNLLSCEEPILKTDDGSEPSMMMPYVNGYLAKLGDDAVNNSSASSYVYNYVPMIQPKGVYAVRAVDVRAVGGGQVETATNDKSTTYISPLVNELKPKRFQAPNTNATTTVKLTNATNPKPMSELAEATDPLDMANWGDKTGVSLVLDSTSINRGTLGDVEFVTSYKYLDTVRHNYRPTLVYNGVTYMAEYVDTTLDYEEQKAVEFTTEVDDAGHDYGESFGNAGTSEFMYTVGFERKARPEVNGEGKTVIRSEIHKFYEVFSNAYDSHTQTYDTQRAVEVNNKIYYANMLAYTDLPYLTEATKSKREGTNANVLTFDKDNMWYLIGHYDEQNPTLDSQLVDVSSIYNATNGTTLANFLDSKVGKRFNTSVIPDPMAGEYLLNYDKVIPMVYGKYTDETIGQSLEFITKDVFAVGSDSGYQVVVKDARVEPNAANWKNGWSDVDVYTGEQYGANNSIKVLTERNILVDALTNDLGLTHAVSDSDKLVTKGRGSLFFLPVDIKLDPVAGNDRYHNRIVVTDLGLNDATYFQDDIITVDTYLFGRGNDVIYSPQRLEIEEGQQVEDIDVLINNAAVNDYKNIPSEQWKTSNGTRMVYSPVLKPFIKSTP